MILLLACAAPLPDPPPAARFEEVEVELAGEWRALGAAATVEGAVATTGPVTVARAVPPAVEITAASSRWDLQARSVHFEGAVRVTRGDFALTCGALDVTYLDATTMDQLRASGSVEVRRGARVATADEARLLARTGEVTLTGHPTLREGPNHLAGERIVLHLDDETATCDGGEGAPCRLVIAGEALRNPP